MGISSQQRVHLGRHLRSGVRLVRRAIGYGLLGAVVVLLLIYIVVLDRREDLELWHEVHLDEEYQQESEVTDF